MQEPRPVRAHLVLCLLGFRGEGYSPTFVEALRAFHDELEADPGRPLELITSPDPICQACPNLGPAGCTLGGPDHEDHMRRQDEDVLARLGLTLYTVLPWSAIRSLIAERLVGTDLAPICTTCPWLGLGYCAEGIEALRAAPTDGPAPSQE